MPGLRGTRVGQDLLPIQQSVPYLRPSALRSRSSSSAKTPRLDAPPTCMTLKPSRSHARGSVPYCSQGSTGLVSHLPEEAMWEKNEAPPGTKKAHNVENLISQGFELIPWEGDCPRPLVEHDDRVFAVLVDRFNDESHLAAADLAFERLCDFTDQASFSSSEKSHRRGRSKGQMLAVRLMLMLMLPAEQGQPVAEKCASLHSR
ncbi:hypothetical protein FPV67DRAFT_1720361 [Lyophyllum atratum]|nr:hypothetical protein FPV67DRAFT_1720361 [Lyophyllum atratum]